MRLLSGSLVFLLFAFMGHPIQAEVIGFRLINAQTDLPIPQHSPLAEGAVIDLADLGTDQLTIEAIVDASPGSVTFDLIGPQNHQQAESVAPYALFGDTDGNFDPWDPSPPPTGNYQLSARTHSQSGGGGTAGSDFTVNFSIAQDTLPPPDNGNGEISIEGSLQRWHRVTLRQAALAATETSSPNPFLDVRFDVLFTAPDGRDFLVPGYFAGDGAGAGSGNTWQAHLSPDSTGTWTYAISFRAGSEVATSLDPMAGSSVSPYDGMSGTFEIAESTAVAPDFRAPARGLVRNRGGHYLTFADGAIFLKGGPDIPENLFGYDGFDNTPNAGHSFAAHASDWSPGDPDWGNGNGRRLIGAFNYIAERGANSVYFLPMNIGGDGQDTFPTIAEFDKTRYDLSKLQQWEIAMAHAQSVGIWLHFVLAETESANENYHDNGNLGPERKLFYRMLVALFGHHNGIQFNLGEENDYGTEKHEEFAAFIKATDPYDHPVTTHTKGNQYDGFYGPLLGNPDFDITSFQGNNSRASMFDLITEWRLDSANTGTPWVISFDEPQKIENNMSNSVGYPHGRRDKMWPVYMAGGGGFEWYVQQDGGGHSLDQQIDDFGIMGNALEWTGHALAFFDLLPLDRMTPDRTIASSGSGGNTYALFDPESAYALYNDRNGGPFSIDLSDASSELRFDITWFDPRTGNFVPGPVDSVLGGGVVDLGTAPGQAGDDWAVLLIGDDDSLFADGFEAGTMTAPRFDPAPTDQVHAENETVDLQLQAVDPDASAPLVFSATGLPPGLSIDSQVGRITGTVSGADGAGPFLEQGGLLVIELESGDDLPANWLIQMSYPDFAGTGYVRYVGSNQFNSPGVDSVRFPIRISTPGTYRFQWRSIVGQGTNTTEHNDTWLKIDADSFFASNGSSTLCPKGFDPGTNDCSGGLPNGSGSNGWFKVYRSGGTASDWRWSTNTSDNDAHQIYARFDSPGDYAINVSGRSTDHVIDRMTLNTSPVSDSEARALSNSESPRTTSGASAASPYSVITTVSDEAQSATAIFNWTINPEPR